MGSPVINPNNPAALGALMRDDVGNFMVAATPGGIEAQEAAGQVEMIAKCQIPREIIGGVILRDLHDLGFTFSEGNDKLFYDATLPTGWTIKATNHSMHSDLVDERGRKRGDIFYKAAFYDRRADLRMSPRYYVKTIYTKDNSSSQNVVWDEGAQTVLLTTDPVARLATATPEERQVEWSAIDTANDTCDKWLNENFPDNRNALAYWN